VTCVSTGKSTSSIYVKRYNFRVFSFTVYLYVAKRDLTRLYALLHPDMGKWGGDAVPQSTVALVCCKQNRQENIYQFEK